MNNLDQRIIWAIVPAAGSSQRMQSKVAKQYLKINDKTILETTLAILLDSEKIEHVVVCIAESDEVWLTLPVAKRERVSDCVGGISRARSVLNGLLSLSKRASDSDWVLVHDAARPCLSKKFLDKIIHEISGEPVGGILAIPAKDTLKQASKEALTIEKTLDRSTIWQAQTPQIFRYGLLKAALENALSSGYSITDEASAMECAGYHPKLVEGHFTNLKVTTPEDLRLAAILLKVL